MSNAQIMIEKLYYAQDNDEEVYISYSSSELGLAFSCSINLIPDLMVVDNWVEITDKKYGTKIVVSFSYDTDINYDEDLEEYYFDIGDGTIKVAV